MKKFITLFLVSSILLLSANLYAKERKGADLIVQKTEGNQISGELIAVKESSLLLLERDSGADVSVDIDEIRFIKIKRKSAVLSGFIFGTFFAVAISVASLTTLSLSTKEFLIGFAGGELIFGGLGAAIFGATFSGYKTIQIEGKSDSEIQEILAKLRKKARVKDSQ